MITELRRYRIDPDRLDSWMTFFAGALEEHARRGMRVEYAGVDRETSTFVWMRSFADEAERVAQKDDFYGSPWWAEREAFAMSHVVEYEVTFLDAFAVSAESTIAVIDMDPSREQPGGRGDAPPDNWKPSTRRSFVRS